MVLVHHVCKEAEGLESLFLISKSNCAFANFKDEQTCAAAQQKLHDSKFQSVRLVSRLRKSAVEGLAGTTVLIGPSAASIGGDSLASSSNFDSLPTVASATTPGITTPASVLGAKVITLKSSLGSGQDSPAGAQSGSGNSSSVGGEGTPPRDRFFILKSLTVEDLELSVKTGIWATQSHNEETLNSAFKVGFACFNFSLFSFCRNFTNDLALPFLDGR